MPAGNREDGWLNLSGPQRYAFTDRLLEVYGWQCWRCHFAITTRPDATCGHIVPRRAGGPTTLENCRPEHTWCNYSENGSAAGDETLIDHDDLAYFLSK